MKKKYYKAVRMASVGWVVYDEVCLVVGDQAYPSRKVAREVVASLQGTRLSPKEQRELLIDKTVAAIRKLKLYQSYPIAVKEIVRSRVSFAMRVCEKARGGHAKMDVRLLSTHRVMLFVRAK